MTNAKFKNIPISDSHLHVWREIPISETLAFHKWVFDEMGYDTTSIMALKEQKPTPGRAIHQTVKAMYLKKMLSPRVYAYADLHYEELSPEDDGTYFLNQAKYDMLCGFDGIKLFYSTGMYDKGFPHIELSDSRFDKFFEYAEKEQIPITLHLGGPEVCYVEDITKVPLSQRKWYSGPKEHDLHYAFRDFIKMMDKFPKLKITVAHFAFITWHPDWAEEWLLKYENLYFDLTPSLFMYFDFQEKPDVWTKFFIDHQDRIIYGTDTGSNHADIVKYEPAALRHVVRGFFEETEPIREFEETFYPMPLPDSVLKKIYKENLMGIYNNKSPKEADYARLYDEFLYHERMGVPTALAKENLDIMKAELLKE